MDEMNLALMNEDLILQVVNLYLRQGAAGR